MRNVALPATASTGISANAKGDALFDWRKAAGRHAEAHIKLLKDEACDPSDFEGNIDEACALLGLDFQHRSSFEQ